ncbi:uncharacterized protein LOC135836424 isoform X2 [Planococcus citri]|uniref:uncharacterized protein LOC135836424 isoform X2 n=1 Tax=Planococcus citri TaxID=170843 RepID=UPI0031F85420
MENPIILRWFPQTLQSIAASQCALIYLRHHYHSRFHDLYPDETVNCNWFWKCESISCDIFHAPKPIKDIIDHHVKQLLKKWISWLNWCGIRFYLKYGDKMLYILDHVELSNGEFDYKSAAKRFVTSDEWSAVEKYQIACLYCLEDDVKRLWHSVPDGASIKESTFDAEPVIYYWNCRMKNELDKIPGNEHDSVELRVLLSERVDDRFQIEYFWGKLNAEEQNSNLKIILRDERTTTYLLPKLNSSQQGYLFRNKPHRLLVNLIGRSGAGGNLSLVLQVWNYVKNSIPGYKFIHLMRELWCFVEMHVEYFCYANVPPLLSGIWTDAPDNLKKYVIERILNRSDDANGADDDDYDYAYNVEFFLDLLSFLRPEFRRNIWNNCWDKFICYASTSDLHEAMKLCFDNEDSLVQFKENEMLNHPSLETKFYLSIEHDSGDEFNKYLQFCLSDEHRLLEVKKQFVDSIMNDGVFDLPSDRFTMKVIDFVNGVFPSLDLARQFRENFIAENLHVVVDLANKNRLLDVKSTVDCFLSSSDECKTAVKKKMYEICENILKSNQFKKFRVRDWHQFLKWCAPSEEEIVKLRESLRVDDIFEKLLPKAVQKSMYFPRYSTALDSFLLWYFTSEEAARMYKRSKISSFLSNNLVTNTFRSGCDRSISMILSWFYDDDVAEIENFRVNFTPND